MRNETIMGWQPIKDTLYQSGTSVATGEHNLVVNSENGVEHLFQLLCQRMRKLGYLYTNQFPAEMG